MLVLLVRHAESENNIVQAGVHAKLQSRQLNPVQAQEQWLENRYEDPGLSVNGLKQAAKLKKHIKQVERMGIKSFLVYCSPMTRACQTANVISQTLGLPANVKPELCEVGGIYRAEKQMRHGMVPVVVKVPGNAKTAENIKRDFPNFSVDDIRPQGPWDFGRGFEETDIAVARARQIAGWLRSAELQTKVGENGCLVLVSHADFLALLISSILGQQPMSSRSNPDGEMSVHGVTEAGLNAELGGETVESVYTKYRISLCSTCLLQLTADLPPDFKWMNNKDHLRDGGCSCG